MRRTITKAAATMSSYGAGQRWATMPLQRGNFVACRMQTFVCTAARALSTSGKDPVLLAKYNVNSHKQDSVDVRVNVSEESRGALPNANFEPSGSALVDSLNAALAAYPMTTSLVYLYHNIALAAVGYGVLTLLQVPVPAELGAAFVLNRLTTRFRVPLVVALAAAVVKLKPAYGKLQLTQLMTAPLSSGLEEARRNHDEKHWNVRLHQLLLKGTSLLNMGGVIDKLGLSYVLCGRVVATTSILGLYFALSRGIDTSVALDWLSSHGINVADWAGEAGEAVADWMARWTAACLVINVSYPLVLKLFVADFSMWLGQRHDEQGINPPQKTEDR